MARKKKQGTNFIPALILGGAVIFGAFAGLRQAGVKEIVRKNNTVLQKIIVPKEKKVPIFVYHYVEYVKDQNDTIRKSLSTTPLILEMQIKTLKDGGYTFITMDRLGEYLNGKAKLPQKPVVLTFDDGYEDFYTDVFPLLKKYKAHATQYVVSGFISKKNYMSEKQLKEIIKSGIVEIGAHTVNHYNLKSLSDEEASYEISESKNALEKEFGVKVKSFAYPYGGYNDNTPALVRKAGYSTAVTTEGGVLVSRDESLTLFRIHPGIRVGEELLDDILTTQ